MKLAWLVALLVAPGAAAGSAEAPELVDPAGDQTMQSAPVGVFGRGLDLRAVWFTDDSAGIHATIRVEDLAGLVAEPGQAQSDAMFIAIFELNHADKSGPGGRVGEWRLRADYQAGNSVQWSYGGEGPCLDGDDTDGCAGQDRDIIDPLPGSHDLDNSTVTITLPWEHLGKISHGDGIHGLAATTQFVYPAWPVYTVDWDNDQAATAQYQYTSPESRAPPKADSGASGSNRTVRSNSTSEGPLEDLGATKESPGPAVLLVVAGLIMLARRRQP